MTKRINNTKKANLTLGGITLGFLLSYPFHGGFVGGLIASGCSAGMIGGLADWFAVTALFRRPLGIRPGKIIRTEIIPQNRERIFVALADMVQDELLSQDVLQRKLSAWDFSGVLIRILSKPEVKLSIEPLLTNLAEDVVRHMGQGEFTQGMQGLLQENMGSMNLSQTLAEVIEFSLDHGGFAEVLGVICRAINEYVEQPEVKAALINTMDAALIRYGDNNATRKMVVKFLPAPAVLAHGLQEKVKTALQDGTVERWLKDSLLHFVLELKTKSSLQESINKFIYTILDQNPENSAFKKKDATLIAVIEHLRGNLSNNWDGYLGILEGNQSLRLKVDERVKLLLEKQIGLHHKTIGRMVREGLDPLTDDKLVELIEDKAGNDLQMIRINGSVVGGLAGMLIYVLGMVLK
ncbi:DUF445 domain-containing protein [Desulfosporosinus fructosivorans]|uniref:DUF445 domain-containing protein n=1 Tax=Desulfosporosinus fructosivorans TaxID=2018669 RepID=A0A4Z0RBI2_9FIRM|nr:DUF445 domain-containing protein [Desulfosporosinus fructosivorans]TGE39527.1 DUF445 domain-containing protein [Desulfosporosinus fructosivorans]